MRAGNSLYLEGCNSGMEVLNSASVHVAFSILADNCLSKGIKIDNNCTVTCSSTVSIEGYPTVGLEINASKFMSGSYFFAEADNYCIYALRGAEVRVSGDIFGTSTNTDELFVTGGSIISGAVGSSTSGNIAFNTFTANGIIWDF